MQDIIAVKLTSSKLLYQANWVRYNKDLEFYPASDFKYALHKLKAFHDKNKALPGPL